MHQLIAHGLINSVKLDYGGIVFNDLAAKLTNSVRHTSPAYARSISLILNKAQGDSFVLPDEIVLKIPVMGNSIFSLDPTLLEVPISSHMFRVCQCVPDPFVVSQDVAGSGDQNLKDDCPVNSNQFCNYQNNVGSFQEEVVGDTIVPTGSGENLKDDCPVISNQVCNFQNSHYNINSFPQRQSGAFPGDLSLGIPFPGDLSPGKRRWRRLVRDSFPSDNSWRK
nr:hypothetical protein [Tanacetum cinerariifolium]